MSNDEISATIHDLFMNTSCVDWVASISHLQEGKWYSVVAELSRNDAPVHLVTKLGENVYSKLVYTYLKAPDYKTSGMLMVQFTVSGGIWSSVVWHKQGRENDS
jgi:hypothetical protein